MTKGEFYRKLKAELPEGYTLAFPGSDRFHVRRPNDTLIVTEKVSFSQPALDEILAFIKKEVENDQKCREQSRRRSDQHPT